MKWEKIVEIQYDAMQRTSTLFIAILGAIVVFIDRANFSQIVNIALVFSFFLVISQNIAVLYLTNVQRTASWRREHNENPTRENLKENLVRICVLALSSLSAISIIVTIAFIVFLRDAERAI